MSLCDEGCEYCIYCTLAVDPATEGYLNACEYILRTGHRRPCKAGRDCTARIVGTEKRNLRIRNATETKRRYQLRVAATLKGKQTDAFAAFMAESGMSFTDIANAMCVSRDTVKNWAYERSFAPWNRLEIIGFHKPKDL